MANDVVSGGCFCGAVRFEVTLPSAFCVHCHCTMCRRIHGAAFVTWFGLPKEQVRVTAGEDTFAVHRSSDQGERSFCSKCGTPLFCETTHMPGVLDVTLASMDGPIDREPEAHVHYDTHVGWLERLGELPRLDVE